MISRKLHQRPQHRRHRTFRVARPAPVDAAIAQRGNKLLRRERANGVHVRRKENAFLDRAAWRKAGKDIRTALNNVLHFDIQSRLGSSRRQEIRDAPFARQWVALRQKSRIDARQRDQFTREFFDFGHRRRLIPSPTGARQSLLVPCSLAQGSF